jgi:hypothetical protein
MNRKCVVRVGINPGNRWTLYSLSPLKPAELPSPFVAGFTLLNRSNQTRYMVRVTADGAVNCTCPQWQKTERCKHADALRASGLLPVALLEVLASRNQLLARAESTARAAEARGLAQVEAVAADAAQDRAVWEHDRATLYDKVRELESSLAAVVERNQQLERGLAAVVPIRRSRTRNKKSAA